MASVQQLLVCVFFLRTPCQHATGVAGRVLARFCGHCQACVLHSGVAPPPPPMVIAGDANIWHPHFNLGRSRSCDSIVIPFVDFLMVSCQLRLCNPPDRATHISGAGLDCIFISSSHGVEVTVHDGDDCCAVAPFLVCRSWIDDPYTTRVRFFAHIATLTRLEAHSDACSF